MTDEEAERGERWIRGEWVPLTEEEERSCSPCPCPDCTGEPLRAETDADGGFLVPPRMAEAMRDSPTFRLMQHYTRRPPLQIDVPVRSPYELPAEIVPVRMTLTTQIDPELAADGLPSTPEDFTEFRRRMDEAIARAYQIPEEALFAGGRRPEPTYMSEALLRADRSIAEAERDRHNWNMVEHDDERYRSTPLAPDSDESSLGLEDVGWHLDGCPWLRPVTLEGGFAESEVPLCNCYELDEDEETLIPS